MTSPGGSTSQPAVTPAPETPITHPNLSLLSFSANDPNQDATSFWNSVENKILFSLGTRLQHPLHKLAMIKSNNPYSAHF